MSESLMTRCGTLQCALPGEDIKEMVGLMLGMLSCGYDPARKNAVLFLGAALSFRAVLSIFDASSGLARLLDCLQTVLMLLHGQQDLKAEKQVETCSAVHVLAGAGDCWWTESKRGICFHQLLCRSSTPGDPA